MISFFKRNKKGIAGKIILFICILLMLPFGVDLLGGGGSFSGNTVVRIDDVEISAQAYARELNRMESVLRSQFGENYELVLQAINVKQQVLDGLVERTLLSRFLENSDLRVGTPLVKSYIANLPIFNGEMSQAKFEAFLKGQGLTERQFVHEVSQRIIGEQMDSILGLASFTNKELAKKRYSKSKQKAVYSYAEISAENEAATEEEIQKYFNERGSQFTSRRAYKVALMRTPVSAFKSEIPYDDQDIADAYARMKFKYATPAQVQLVRAQFVSGEGLFGEGLEEKSAEKSEVDNSAAQSFWEEASKNPDSFEVLAKSRGAIIIEDEKEIPLSELGPALKKAIKDVGVGEISEVFSDKGGDMVVKVVSRTAGGYRPIEEVRSELEEVVIAEMLPDISKHKIKAIRAKLEGVPLETVVNEMKVVSLKNNYEFSVTENPISSGDKANIDMSVWQKIEKSTQGDFVLEVFGEQEKQEIVLAFVEEIVEPRPLPYEAVRNRIKTLIEVEKRSTAARKQALMYIQQFVLMPKPNYDLMSAVFQNSTTKLVDTEPMALENAKLPFVQNPNKVKGILLEVLGKGYSSKPVLGDDSKTYIVVRKSLSEPEMEEFDKDYASYVETQYTSIISSLRSRLVNELKAQADIEVNQEVLSAFQ